MDSIWLPSNAFAPAEIYGRGAIPLFYESAAVNPYDGQVVKLRRVSDQSARAGDDLDVPAAFRRFLRHRAQGRLFHLPAFCHLARMTSGEGGLGAGAPVTVQAGPYALRLVEFATDAPLDLRAVQASARCSGWRCAKAATTASAPCISGSASRGRCPPPGRCKGEFWPDSSRRSVTQ